jgi:hypothetical protein
MFLLPILNRAFPEFVFVHVLRDGRDMLFSENRNQPRMHYKDLFGRSDDVTPDSFAAFWSTVNLQAAAYGTRVLKSRYILLRLEDFCSESRLDYAVRLAQKLKLDRCRVVAHLDIFRTPSSLGPLEGTRQGVARLDGGLWHGPCPFRLLLMPWPGLFIELATPVFVGPGWHEPDRHLHLPRMPVQVTG